MSEGRKVRGKGGFVVWRGGEGGGCNSSYGSNHSVDKIAKQQDKGVRM